MRCDKSTPTEDGAYLGSIRINEFDERSDEYMDAGKMDCQEEYSIKKFVVALTKREKIREDKGAVFYGEGVLCYSAGVSCSVRPC